MFHQNRTRRGTRAERGVLLWCTRVRTIIKTTRYWYMFSQDGNLGRGRGVLQGGSVKVRGAFRWGGGKIDSGFRWLADVAEGVWYQACLAERRESRL